MPVITDSFLAEQLSDCAPGFQAQLDDIAECGGKNVLDVYRWWREYSSLCRAYDQSALLGEFRRWYAERLN